MLVRKENEWRIAPYKVTFTHNGTENEKYTDNQEYWETFAEKWGITDLSFVEVNPSTEQLERLADVQYIDRAYQYECSVYVEKGEFPEGRNHALKDVQYRKDNEAQGQVQTDAEINNMIQGQRLTELEIKIMQMGAV